MRHTLPLLFLIALIAAGSGCGRKLPPLPPGEAEPVTVQSMRFNDGQMNARITCNADGGKITLLGKPQGICPNCTDDLTPRQEITGAAAGVYVLRDEKPDAVCMVYRVRMEKGETVWLSPARIVCNK